MKILLLLLFPFISFGQVFYSGVIVNKETKQGIPFATVGLIKQNIGTNADEGGHFKFNSNSSKLDTFIVSSVGYETSKIPVDKVSSFIQFELQPKEATLKEVVVVSNYNWKSTTLGKYSNCGSHYYTTSNAINQVARHFRATNANSHLSEIEICKYGIAVIDPARTKFRVRIYSMDMLTQAPSKDLCDSIIELDVTGRRIKVNLEKYHITIPDKDFFVAVEWLRIPLNEEKNKSKFGGDKKIIYSSYSPLLAIKENLNDNSDLECWQLDYTGKWRPFRWTLMISATVKY